MVKKAASRVKGRSKATKLAASPQVSNGNRASQRADSPELSLPAYQLAQAVEHSSDLIAMADLEGNFTYANSAFLQSVGFSKSEVIGKHFRIAVSPNNVPGLIEEMGARMYEPRGWRGECLVPRRDGGDFLVMLSVGPVQDYEGRTIGAFGIARDITEQRRIEQALRQSETQFRELAEHIRVVFYVSIPKPFQVTYVSPAYDEIWGRPRSEVHRNPVAWVDAIHPEERERVFSVLEEMQTGVETYMEYRIVRPDGSIRWIANSGFPVRDENGNFVRAVGIAEDITERVQRERSLEEAHTKLNEALAQSARMATDTAKLGDVVEILQSCQTVDEAYKVIQNTLQTGWSSRAGALCLTSASRNIVEVVANWGQPLNSEKTFRPEDCWALRRGKAHEVLDAASPVRCAHVTSIPPDGYVCVPLAAQGETLGVLYVERPAERPAPPADGRAGKNAESPESLASVATRVGERISLAIANLRLRHILRNQSIRDPLSGLFNRRYMEESLEREFSRAARNKECVSVLMLDIDHFKMFNDTFGHQAGDKVLEALGDLLNQSTRGQDIACRYGGEEFALILSGTNLEGACARAELLRQDLKNLAVECAGQTLRKITVSIGVAVSTGLDVTPEELIRSADRALYTAKLEGRDRVVTRA